MQTSIGQPMLLSHPNSGRYDNNKMQNSTGQPTMLLSLAISVRYGKNKLHNRTGQPMLLSLPSNWRYNKKKMLLR
jgi:hypothetical protein